MTRRSAICATLMASTAPAASRKPAAAAAASAWERRLEEVLPQFGHRNWIVVADSAYPAQARPSIETLVTAADQIQVVGRVLGAIASSKHVTPTVYTDRELKFVAEADAPGITAYRRQLGGMLKGYVVNELAHERLIAQLDEAGQTFRVLIIKTSMTLPYTSVFLRLDCAYWNADAEQKLRAVMGSAPPK
jgi:hypothetical protein